MSANLQHVLTGTEFTGSQIQFLLDLAQTLKKERAQKQLRTTLRGQSLALLFDKLSLRTRFSFTIAMRELGGDAIESFDSTRKFEEPEDHARVLSGYCHAIMIRTHHDSILERMAQTASVPLINGLSDLHHPCQILADLLTLQEKFESVVGKTVCYIGDGNNILHSLLLMAPKIGVNIHYCCPVERSPDPAILAQSLAQLSQTNAKIAAFPEPQMAVVNADAVYTDVWTSMGFEDAAAEHLFVGYQVNERLMQQANVDAIFMHCLPMIRGKEVSETLPDSPSSVIFQQSENRLHVQKALLLFLLEGKNHD